MKLCADCIYLNEYWNCSFPMKSKEVMNFVSGEKITTAKDPRDMRLFEWYCGAEAQWFFPREERAKPYQGD